MSVPQSPLQRAIQEERTRQYLNDTSPRNMNEQPKVVPEFIKTYRMSQKSKNEKTEEILPRKVKTAQKSEKTPIQEAF